MGNYNTFPFVAIIGQEKIKKALILNCINPKIGGVLLCGEKGTAKSTLVRGLAELMRPMKLIELPLNITEDRLLGGIDIKEAIINGKKVLESGVLHQANGNLLYIDEVNLLSEHIVNILLEVSSTGYSRIEREGISCSLTSTFSLVGSMNPEEGKLRSHFLDRFGLYVTVEGEKNKADRCRIIKRRLKYESNPTEFIEGYKKELEELKKQIVQARKNLKSVSILVEQFEFAAELAETGNCQGHRGELVLLETARALGAFYGINTITNEILREAAEYALPHRIREKIQGQEEQVPSQEEQFPEPIQDISNQRDDTEIAADRNNDKASKNKEEEQWEDVVRPEKEITLNMNFKRQNKQEGSGKRTKVRSDTAQGRYVKYRFPNNKVKDIAVDATIRSAVMHPASSEALRITVKNEDIREKVREQRTGATILFLVDASGSMGAKRRMGAVKGAILSLLNDAYQKRDLIGMVAFRNTSADVLLPITRSTDLAQKHLKQLKTGGKSPLAAGLLKAFQLLKVEKIKNPYALQYLVLVTDGKANIPLLTSDSMKDAVTLGEKIRYEGIHSMVLDTESGFIRYGQAKKLAEAMDATYINLQTISTNEVKETVQSFMEI